MKRYFITLLVFAGIPQRLVYWLVILLLRALFNKRNTKFSAHHIEKVITSNLIALDIDIHVELS